MKRKDLRGFHYDAKRKRVVLDGFVPAWNEDLASGLAIERPLTLSQFRRRLLPPHLREPRAATKKSQDVIIKNHLLRYFGDDELTTVTSIRVIDFMADMRAPDSSPPSISPLRIGRSSPRATTRAGPPRRRS